MLDPVRVVVTNLSAADVSHSNKEVLVSVPCTLVYQYSQDDLECFVLVLHTTNEYLLTQ